MPERHAQAADSVEQRYRLLVESVTDYAIYMLDPEGRVASWNAGAARLKGYQEHEVIGSHFSRFYPDDEASAGQPSRNLETAVRRGRFEGEGWRRRKDGSSFWAHVVIEPIRATSGELLGYAKITRDLTERRAAEEALRRSEEQFRLLVQGVTDYAIYMLDPAGNITSWNAGAERIKGFAPQEVIGTHFSRFYRQQDREREAPANALAVAAREGRFESDGWRVRKDGTEFRANVVIDPIRDAAGQIIGFAKVTRDITERYQASLALNQAQEALFQAQKLDAIGQLSGGIAHDFNNLLMVVLSSLELIRRRIPQDDAKLRQLAENAMAGARRGASLTQRMLAFARRQDLKPEIVDIPALVAGMTDLLERSLGPTIRVSTRFDGDLHRVLIDANQLELAILNLAVNARDAMPHGGLLLISAGEHVIAPGEGRLAPGVYVRLAVSDSGTGMDAETLTHATEPFFTTKGVGKGTGLGLPMVHGLAAQSGGELRLESAPGKGTTAELWIPIAPHAEAASAVDSVHSPAAPMRSLNVVVVDDDNLVLASTVAMLEDLGHTAVPAASAEDALRLVRESPGVELVVTDQMMPDVTGIQLIALLQAERPALAFILATGYAELTDVPPSAVRLSKPFGQEQLVSAIEEATMASAATRTDRS